MTRPNDPTFHQDVEEHPHDPQWCCGITKREYFAAAAMNGISFWDATFNEAGEAGKVENLARACVAFADALIEELNKKQEA